MAGTKQYTVIAGKADIRGAKNETDIAVITDAIADLIVTELDGTEGTHPQYMVEVTVRPMGI